MFSVSALFCRDSVVRGCKGLELTGRAVYCSGLSLVYATRYCFATRETPPKLFFALTSCRQQGFHLPIGFATVKWYQIERSVPPSSSVSPFPSFPRSSSSRTVRTTSFEMSAHHLLASSATSTSSRSSTICRSQNSPNSSSHACVAARPASLLPR